MKRLPSAVTASLAGPAGCVFNSDTAGAFTWIRTRNTSFEDSCDDPFHYESKSALFSLGLEPNRVMNHNVTERLDGFAPSPCLRQRQMQL